MLYTTSFVLLGTLLPAFKSVSATTYSMVKEYSGSTFFDDWDFYDHYDNLTNGDAIFVSREDGISDSLAYVDTTTNRAIMKVDNTTTVAYNDKRNTVRIATQDRFSVGSIWTADIYHVPYGCSVWPAWWSQAPDWPSGGEIDTFEGVNQVTLNQMALHTKAGCTQVSSIEASTSLVNSTDCSYLTNSNQGCVVTDPSTDSYGAGFASANGGLFVTEYAETGISIWFFDRASIPSTFTSNDSSLDTSDLGTPVANWPTGGCDMDTYFAAQNLIFDITLCGDWAGASTTFATTCTGTCYTDYVVGDGSVYDTAYFDVASVKVYSTDGSNTVVSASASAASATSSSGAATLTTISWSWAVLLGASVAVLGW